MHVTFMGATREVTGSTHLVSGPSDKILLDCGLFQGRRRESEIKNRTLPYDPGLISNVVLSHAHIDHSGKLPVLARSGFPGRILATRPTADACAYLLEDSAHIQEIDARYLNYKSVRRFLTEIQNAKKRNITNREIKSIKDLLKKNKYEIDVDAIEAVQNKYDLQRVTPLYTHEDVEKAIGIFDGVPYRHPFTVGKNLTCTLYDAGHILGSAFVVVRAGGNGRRQTVFFTGDMGRFNKPIIEDPTLDFDPEDREVDLLIMESTYGGRKHEPVKELRSKLGQVVSETVARGGCLVIPSFAFGRTQEILYFLHQLYDENVVPHVPVFVDSPLAVKLTKVFGEHPEVYDSEAHNDFLERGKNPFAFKQIRFVSSTKDSMALMEKKDPHIVIAGSGMCEGGRVVHHLRYKIHNERNTILTVGYMAAHTLGRRLIEAGRSSNERRGRNKEEISLRFLGKEYPLRAKVVELGGFSAHADGDEMLDFLRRSNLQIKKIALVHGEEDQSLALARKLENEGYAVVVPRRGETLSVNGL